MHKIYRHAQQGSYFSVCSLAEFSSYREERTFALLWCREGELRLEVDLQTVVLNENEVLPLAFNQPCVITQQAEGIAFLYNRDFYCIVDHDKEVGCAGLLYFGATQIAKIQLDPPHTRKFELLLQVFLDEFETEDNIQEDMLRMLLKRLIILCTRLLKTQTSLPQLPDEREVIRQFRLLLELHFREKQSVSAYAELLNRSPKTLSNVFAKHGEDSPSKQIQERIALEAKRLLLFTEKSVKEISYELTFEEVTHFSRFFKRNTHMSPSEFRKTQLTFGKK
ncbi:MAG: helix-turn-helix domain-containing protein [Bacteroidota bacterium]